MKARFWAIILIFVCGLNSLGISFAGVDNHASSSARNGIFTQSKSIETASPKSVRLGAVEINTDSDCSHDCSNAQGGDCHYCHLGHCAFIMGAHLSLHAPEICRGTTTTPYSSYLSISLATRKKPPRV